jgi:hypothetical protein
MTNTYDPKAILFTFLGIPLSGFADGTFIKVERNDDTFKLVVGSDGESARARNRNRSGRITLTLLQTSPSNDYLSAAQRADELGIPGGKGPLLVKDVLGTTLINAPDAWIVKPPAAEFGREVGSREWVFESGDIDMLVGGNVI